MFNLFTNPSKSKTAKNSRGNRGLRLEALEGRQLMSISPTLPTMAVDLTTTLRQEGVAAMVSASQGVGAAINAPSSLRALNVQSRTLTLSWRDNSGVETGFAIQWSYNNRNWSTIGTVGANVTSVGITGLTPNSVSYFRIYAYNSSATSALSNTINSRTAQSFLGLGDAGLEQLTRSLYSNDSRIDRKDMISILRSAGNDDGRVDATEINDLKKILANASTLKIPGYVQILAGDVVNGNRANASFQGQSLGNLVSGSSSTQMNRLVDKWFLGADRPTTTNGSYVYRYTSGSLYVNGASYTDEHQGYLGDCYLIATLGSIAKSNPSAIGNMFIDNGDGSWTVRFFANGKADYVTVDRYLPSDSSGRLVYSNVGAAFNSGSNELWMALAEKAYAQWNETGKEGRDGRNAYGSIEGGWMQNVDAQVLGYNPSVYWGTFSDSRKSTLVSALNSNKAVQFGTRSSVGGGLVGGHAYTGLSYNRSTDRFTLYNPWGSSQPQALSWAQLKSYCSVFVVTSTSSVRPAGLLATPGASQILAAADTTFAATQTTVAPAAPAPQTPADALFAQLAGEHGQTTQTTKTIEVAPALSDAVFQNLGTSV